MPQPGVHIETIHNPGRYSHAQIEYAAAIASELARGKLVLIEAPANHPADDDDHR